MHTTDRDSDELFMQAALDQADEALALGELPVGAVLIHRGEIVGSTPNSVRGDSDLLQHAELRLIQEAQVHRFKRWKLEERNDMTLYTTLELMPSV